MMKFSEDTMNLSVFTSRHILEEGAPVLYVVHDEEGDWQFLGSEDVVDEDVRIISMKQMLEHDPSLHKLANMPRGMEAIRNNRNENFTKIKLSE